MFREAYRQRRCFVPADGFYEWEAVKGSKQPYFVHMKDDGIFTMAGVWEEWQPPEGPAVETFTILTTRPNELLAPIHDRMPVVVDEKDRGDWRAGKDAKKILRPFDASRMDAYPISSRINSPRNDDARLIERTPGNSEKEPGTGFAILTRCSSGLNFPPRRLFCGYTPTLRVSREG